MPPVLEVCIRQYECLGQQQCVLLLVICSAGHLSVVDLARVTIHTCFIGRAPDDTIWQAVCYCSRVANAHTY